MPKRPHRKPPVARKGRGEALGMGTKAKPHHTPLIALRLPVAMIARADELVPAIAATGELVGVSRSLVLRLAIDEGLRVLRRKYGGVGDD